MDDPQDRPGESDEAAHEEDPAPEPFWQDWEVTSDDDVRRDTFSPSRQRALKRALRDD